MASSSGLEPESTWPGWNEIRHLFVFGASYTSVTFDGRFESPTENLPMGIEWPGFTSCEEDHPNYIGHLQAITQSRRSSGPTLLVYDYAVPGHTAADQLKLAHARFAGSKPDGVHWDASDSLFMIQIGINDCARLGVGVDIATRVGYVMELMQMCYDLGVRNFCFLNVPHVNRAPAAMSTDNSRRKRIHKRVLKWNATLAERLTELSALEDVTIIPFALDECLNRILDEPEVYHFPQEEVSMEGGSIWFDHLHPTTAVHGIIAEQLHDALEGVAPISRPPAGLAV